MTRYSEDVDYNDPYRLKYEVQIQRPKESWFQSSMTDHDSIMEAIEYGKNYQKLNPRDSFRVTSSEDEEVHFEPSLEDKGEWFPEEEK